MQGAIFGHMKRIVRAHMAQRSIHQKSGILILTVRFPYIGSHPVPYQANGQDSLCRQGSQVGRGPPRPGLTAKDTSKGGAEGAVDMPPPRCGKPGDSVVDNFRVIHKAVKKLSVFFQRKMTGKRYKLINFAHKRP